MIVGPDGHAWLTEGGQNAIARVDANTKAVKLFPLPKEFPQRQSQYARLRRQRHGLVHRPERRLRPRRSRNRQGRRLGVAEGPRHLRHHRHAAGDIWYASLAGDHIARVDPASGEATVVDPPRKGVGPRRIWSNSKGVLWVSFWHGGAIGRYDPAARTWTTYPMPQSRSGTYSIYVDDKDRVWATDWMANAIQRFDPKTEAYETFPSDKKSANVRQMLGRPGEAWGGKLGTDRLVVIRD